VKYGSCGGYGAKLGVGVGELVLELGVLGLEGLDLLVKDLGFVECVFWVGGGCGCC